jgi:hypothetical protein
MAGTAVAAATLALGLAPAAGAVTTSAMTTDHATVATVAAAPSNADAASRYWKCRWPSYRHAHPWRCRTHYRHYYNDNNYNYGHNYNHHNGHHNYGGNFHPGNGNGQWHHDGNGPNNNGGQHQWNGNGPNNNGGGGMNGGHNGPWHH